jgi:AbrB family looped-hinge helix DNA binding protein
MVAFSMRITIDAAGRVIIPKSIRDSLGLTGGRTIEIREREGVIEIEPATTAMRLEERNGHPVAVPDRELPPLTDGVVRATLEKTRR